MPSFPFNAAVLAFVTTQWGCGVALPDADGAVAASSIALEYVAHAAFVVESPAGTRLLIDPYASRVWLGYDFPEGLTPDGVAVTHPHYDHDAGVFRGADFPWPEVPVISEPGVHLVEDMTVHGVEGKHADPYGHEFGQVNTIFVIEVGGLKLAHLGDNGPLTPENVQSMGRIDVLMIPADADYHILSAEETDAVIAAVEPRVVVPMHYRIPELESDPDSPDDLGELGPWLEGRGPVAHVGGHRFELSPASLPDERTLLVFDPSPGVRAALVEPAPP